MDGPDTTVDSVGTQDQIRVRPRVERFDFHAVAEVDAQLAAAIAEDPEQGGAGESAEPVPRRRQALAAVVDVDVIPVMERAGDRLVAGGVGYRELFERGVGKDDAEAEGVVGPVPFEHDHFVPRVGPLHEDGEVESGGSAPHADDLHARFTPRRDPTRPPRGRPRR